MKTLAVATTNPLETLQEADLAVASLVGITPDVICALVAGKKS
jgi:hypothetical protein